ncbi:MAG: GspE/PulE family protein, partial [Planctomycetota bacterium]
MTKRQTLEELVVSDGLLSKEDLGKARAYGQGRGLPLEKAITALQLAPENEVYRRLAQAAGMRFADLEASRVPAALLDRIPSEQIEQNGALPVAEKSGVLWVAIDDPLKSYVADNLEFVAGCEVRCVLAAPKALKSQLRRVLGEGSGDSTGNKRKTEVGSASDDPDAPIIRLVERTISDAVKSRASDIHIEPFEGRIRIRNRIDGVLREQAILDNALQGALISRLKIMASLDIAEKRKPQDGRIELRVDDRAIDIRTSLLPSNHGESVVMRLLDKEKNLLSLEALGFAGEDRAR